MTKSINRRRKYHIGTTALIAVIIIVSTVHWFIVYRQASRQNGSRSTTTISVSDTDSGETVNLKLGQTLKISLLNTGWNVAKPSNQKVVSYQQTTIIQSNQKFPEGETILSYRGSSIGQANISALMTIHPDCNNPHLMCPQFIRIERFYLNVRVIPYKQ